MCFGPTSRALSAAKYLDQKTKLKLNKQLFFSFGFSFVVFINFLCIFSRILTRVPLHVLKDRLVFVELHSCI